MGDQDRGRGRTAWSGRSLVAATRRLGAVVVTVLYLGAASVPNAQVASADLLGPSSTVRVIITADTVGSAQALVLSVSGRVVTTLPLVDGVVADVNSSLLPLLGLGLAGLTVTPDVPVAVGSPPPPPSPTVNLGTAAAASVLAGAGVTNTGPSVLNRDLDTYPTPAVTGFQPGITMGTQHAADAVALAAQNDLTTAYNAAAGAPSTSNVTGVDLGGETLTPGVYTAAAGMALTGALPLTLTGTADSVYIFQAGSTLITGSNSSVILSGGVQASNVFWQVGSSATLGTGTAFKGNILALTSITVATGASVDGRALARNGAVTLDSNVFENSPPPPRSPAAVFPQASRASSLVAAGTDGVGVNVAVVDTGIDNLPDFAGRLVSGVDLSGEGNALRDSYGHGTFVAGLIAGNGASSAGRYVGEAPGAGLVSVKVAGVSGTTDMGTVIAGIQWAVANRARLGIQVLNLSLGTPPTSSTTLNPLDQAAEAAWNSGIVVVVSAANAGPSNGTIMSPGDDPLVVTVGALDDNGTAGTADDTMTTFSSVGPTSPDGWFKPDLVASGRSVVSLRAPGSAIDNNHPSARIGAGNFVGSGTSFSAAITSGAVAQILQSNPGAVPDQVKGRLLATATRGPTGNPFVDGHGALDAYAAATAGGIVLTQTRAGSAATGAGAAVSLATTWSRSTWNSSAWNGTSWNTSAWNTSAWNTSAWNTSAWNGAAFNGSVWNSSAWNSSAWNGTTWNTSAWNTSVWNTSVWNTSAWNTSAWNTSAWNTSAWNTSAWNTSAWNTSAWS
jgi:serine protease AprX